MATSNILHIFTKLHYVQTYVPIYNFKVFSLQNNINYSTCTNVRRILLCSSVRGAYTWKIVFKTQNNELNELSGCMLYKMFCFSGKYLKIVKLSIAKYFPESLLACLLCFAFLLKLIKLSQFSCLLALHCLL